MLVSFFFLSFFFTATKKGGCADLRNLVPGGGRFLRAFPRGPSCDLQRCPRETLLLRVKIDEDGDSQGRRHFQPGSADERFIGARRATAPKVGSRGSNGERSRKGELADRKRKRATRSKNPSSVDRRDRRFLFERWTLPSGERTRSILETLFRNIAKPRGKSDRVHTWTTTRWICTGFDGGPRDTDLLPLPLAAFALSSLPLLLRLAARVLLLHAGNPNLFSVPRRPAHVGVYATRLSLWIGEDLSWDPMLPFFLAPFLL